MLYEQTSVIITTQSRLRGMAPGLWRQEDDHGHARPDPPSRRDHRNRERLLEIEAQGLLIRLLRKVLNRKLLCLGVGQNWMPIVDQFLMPIDNRLPKNKLSATLLGNYLLLTGVFKCIMNLARVLTS